MKMSWRGVALRPFVVVALACVVVPSVASAGNLDGSHHSMVNQHRVAARLDYTFVRSAAQLEHLVAIDALVPVVGTADLTLDGVSYAYARPEVNEFVQRLAKAYHETTGTPLVVTSLTRPTSSQPRNASPLSVHPAGMAVDLRVPVDDSSRAWLEQVLLKLESAGVLDVTRERHPPHLHVAVFPEAFRAYTAPWDSVTVRWAARPPAVASQPVVMASMVPTSAPANTTLPFVLLLGFDLALVGGIVFAVRRGPSAE